MKIEEFNELSPEDQHRTVARRGVMLRDRITHSFMIFLYALDGFYIELFFHKASGVLAALKPFDSTDGLTPYLEEIDLRQLLTWEG